MRKILITLLIILSCQTFGHVQEFKLNNGLKILVKEDHRAPIAVSMLWFKVGSADEPRGLTGVSHVIEHMMFKGTSLYPLGMFSKQVADGGGESNAFTSNDYTAFFEKMEVSQLAKSMELEADRMQNLLLKPEEFAKEIQVIQEERRMRTDDNPQALAFERFLATANLSLPYAHPVIGWMDDLKRMQVDDVKKWYQTYYVPNNATLVVVGDVKPQQILEMAKKYFSKLKPGVVVPRREQTEPPSLGKKSIQINTPTGLPFTMVGYAVPSLKTANIKYEPYALELISSILDAGDSARFSKELIHSKQSASTASSHYNLYSYYATQFIVFGVPSKKSTSEALQRDLVQVLSKLKSKPVENKELQRIKNQIIAQKTFEKDSIFNQAMELGLLETVGLGWQQMEHYNHEIQAVTVKQIQQTAQKYFNDDNQTSAILKPSQQKG